MGVFVVVLLVVSAVVSIVAALRQRPLELPPPEIEPPLPGQPVYGVAPPHFEPLDRAAQQAAERGEILAAAGLVLAFPPFDVAPRRRTIAQAVTSGWDVDLVYVDEHGTWTARRMTPEWLGGADSGRDHGGLGWKREYFGGHCHLRGDHRTFRFDRVRAVEVIAAPALRDKYRVR